VGKPDLVPIGYVEQRILELRGTKVILDSALAELYGVGTRMLNQAVRRNIERFPDDFAFRLAKTEFDGLRSQSVISNEGRGGRRSIPSAFSEHGAIMAANVLRADRAIEIRGSLAESAAPAGRLGRQYVLWLTGG